MTIKCEPIRDAVRTEPVPEPTIPAVYWNEGEIAQYLHIPHCRTVRGNLAAAGIPLDRWLWSYALAHNCPDTGQELFRIPFMVSQLDGVYAVLTMPSNLWDPVQAAAKAAQIVQQNIDAAERYPEGIPQHLRPAIDSPNRPA